MAYHTSLYLLLFLPAGLMFYQLAPQKWRRVILLLLSFLYLSLLSGKTLAFLLLVVLLVFLSGKWLEKLKAECREKVKTSEKTEKKEIRKRYQKKERCVLALSVLLLLSLLVWVKYYNFFASNSSYLLKLMGFSVSIPQRELFLPVGISFYTLEAIGYLADVYWGKIEAEKEVGKLALFFSFFPKLMEGPICRYADISEKIWNCASLRSENLSEGAVRILWGLFKKMVVADRLYVIVNTVFGHYEKYSGMVVAVAGIAYTLQLYMEFSGCMDIVLGSGILFGIRLPENFRQPFFARSASGFWRRWHISLGVWFRTYIFYPVSVSGAVKGWNRFARKRAGKYVTNLVTSMMVLFPVWFCNGLWHGPSWVYLSYGMYYFLVLFLEVALEPVRDKLLSVCRLSADSVLWKGMQLLKIWVIIFIGELLFRSESVGAAIHMFFSMFRDFYVGQFFDGTLLSLGLGMADYAAVIIGCTVVFAAELFREKSGSVFQAVSGKNTALRWIIYYALIFAVIIFGAYGAGYQAVDLIYAGF